MLEPLSPVLIWELIFTTASDGDTDYFGILAEVLLREILAQYIFIICVDYASIDKIKEYGFELIKKRSWKYPAKKQLPTPTTPMT